MARKLFSDDSENDTTEKSPAAPVKRRAPLIRGGAAAPKYIEGSVHSATERTHEDIPVDQIQDSLIEDRIDVSDGLGELVESIDRNGQQIPIIVRIVNKDRPYEIVAGRRRLAATRLLGKPTIRGFITRMTDEEAFIAQGIENSARLETSFIERARTIVKAREAGFSQENISDFLGIVQSLISSMSRVYEMIGDDLVLAIGPARGVGRRKWESVGNALLQAKLSKQEALKFVDTQIQDSTERFDNFLATITSKGSDHKQSGGKRPTPKTRQTDLLGGAYTMERKPRQLVIKPGKDVSVELLDFISDNLSELVTAYEREKKENEE